MNISQKILSRFSLMLLLALGTASCGFEPVYAPGSKTAAALSDIVVAPPGNNRASYLFVREVEERIGQNLNSDKILQHDVWIYEEDLGLATSTARIQKVGKVTYKVRSVKDNRVLFGGTVENFVAFNTETTITTTVRNEATERLVSILADQMVTELMRQFSNSAND